MKICPNCSKQLDSSLKFCLKCGQEISYRDTDINRKIINNNSKKTNGVINKLGMVSCIILFAIIVFIIIAIRMGMPAKPEYRSGDFQELCRRTCESVGWDDAKFNSIVNNSDGISNSCSSYYCSEHKPTYNTDVSSTESFYGYACKGDCSGHKAGYKWASDKGITNSSDCGGNSQSFIEGCQAYVTGENNFGNSDN